jgi:acyl carrier protein
MGRQSLNVFLCHSSGDKPAVRNLYFRLRSAAFFVVPWLDKEDLLPGQKWEDEICLAVRRSDVVLICLSRTSIQKTGYVQKEIKDALDVADRQPERTIFIIPIKLEECQIPNRLSHLHYVNLFELEGFDSLMRSLSSRAEELGINVTKGLEKRTYSTKEREEIIKRVIATELGVDESALNSQARLEDLGGDWIDAFEIRNRLEVEFEIELSGEDSNGIQIIEDVLGARSQAGA